MKTLLKYGLYIEVLFGPGFHCPLECQGWVLVLTDWPLTADGWTGHHSWNGRSLYGSVPQLWLLTCALTKLRASFPVCFLWLYNTLALGWLVVPCAVPVRTLRSVTPSSSSPIHIFANWTSVCSLWFPPTQCNLGECGLWPFPVTAGFLTAVIDWTTLSRWSVR